MWFGPKTVQTTTFDISTGGLALLLLAQLLHAASYGALHALSVQYIHGYFGQAHHGQGQALYSGLSFGAGGAVGAWMSGLLVEYLGTGAAFWGGAVAATVAPCGPGARTKGPGMR